MSVDVQTIEPVDREDVADLVTARITSATASAAWIVRLGLLAVIGVVIAAVAVGI